jgi:hypothetical protein
LQEIDQEIEGLLEKTESDIMDIVDSSNAWAIKLSKEFIAEAIAKEFLSYVKPKLREYIERELIPSILRLLRSKGLESIAKSREFWKEVADRVTAFYDSFAEAIYEEWLPDVAYLTGEYMRDYIASILEESVVRLRKG